MKAQKYLVLTILDELLHIAQEIEEAFPFSLSPGQEGEPRVQDIEACIENHGAVRNFYQLLHRFDVQISYTQLKKI